MYLASLYAKKTDMYDLITFLFVGFSLKEDDFMSSFRIKVCLPEFECKSDSEPRSTCSVVEFLFLPMTSEHSAVTTGKVSLTHKRETVPL